MEINNSNTLMVKFKVERENENPLSRIINILFISSYCILTVTCVYFYVINPSIKIIIFFISLFFLLTVLLEVVNAYLNTEYIKFKIINNHFIIIKGSEINKFDINKCKIEYNVDKTNWLALRCEEKHFTLSLGQRPTKDLLNFIKLVNEKGDTS